MLVHKESRTGEIYKCICCGYAADADINAANNIFQRFLDGEFTVSCGMKGTRLS